MQEVLKNQAVEEWNKPGSDVGAVRVKWSFSGEKIYSK